jgi:anti-sigma B factor antagonist
MKFSVRTVEKTVVFDLKGGLEGGPESVKVRDAVLERLEKGERKFILNLDKVAFVNSTGIGIITAIYTSITNAGGRMKISNANEKVSRVMMVTRLLGVFDSYYHENDALKAFNAEDTA